MPRGMYKRKPQERVEKPTQVWRTLSGGVPIKKKRTKVQVTVARDYIAMALRYLNHAKDQLSEL